LEKEGETNFGIFGSSFGGFIGIFAAAKDTRVDALVLRSPVTYTDGMFDELRSEVEKSGRVELEEMDGQYIDKSFFEDFDTYDVEFVLKKIKTPTLIFHGTADKVVPFEYSRRFYRNLKATKELVEINGEGHIFSAENDHIILEKIISWLPQHFDLLK
jgi:dipeptidyl aminopeptidase/acylaminoacyl peptidase